jgi:hypothetical protein
VKPVQEHLCVIAIVMEEIDNKDMAREVVDRVAEELGGMAEKFLIPRDGRGGQEGSG